MYRGGGGGLEIRKVPHLHMYVTTHSNGCVGYGSRRSILNSNGQVI